jgi:hypothetical protein
MFNLIVSASPDSWKSKIFSLDIYRCVNKTEYTSEKIANRFGKLNDEALLLSLCMEITTLVDSF